MTGSGHFFVSYLDALVSDESLVSEESVLVSEEDLLVSIYSLVSEEITKASLC